MVCAILYIYIISCLKPLAFGDVLCIDKINVKLVSVNIVIGDESSLCINMAISIMYKCEYYR